MKLFERVKAYIERKNGLEPQTPCPEERWSDLTESMRALESDSELLADLIEMLDCNGMWWLEEFDDYWAMIRNQDPSKFSETQGRGATPKEAIAEAVKRWKGESK